MDILAEIRAISPITSALERLFFFLRRISPGTLILGDRLLGQREIEAAPTPEHGRGITARRCRRMEWYILGWLAMEVVFLALTFAGAMSHSWVRYLVLVMMVVRILEVSQSAANVNIFDHLRLGKQRNLVGALARTFILSVWSFVELIVCFGVIYSVCLHNLKEAIGWSDALYFSAITQLTIGYGDIQPLGPLRLVAMVQGLLGFLFGIVVLSRTIAFLPRMEPVAEDG